MEESIKKTKVWIVIWGLKDGGAEVLAREYARLVDRQSFEASIVTMYPFEQTANYQRAMDAGLRILSVFKKRNAVTRAVRVLFGEWYIPLVLKALLKRERPDTIHFNSQMAYCFAPIRKQLSDIKLLYTCHSEASKYLSKKEEAAVRLLIKENDLQLIALHEDMKKELDQWFHKENTVVIRNGVDLHNFCEVKKSKSEVRNSIGISRDAYVVGHVGRFGKVKNHSFLLQVFEKIIVKKPETHLLLVGNGELQEEITQEIHQKKLDKHVTILSHRTDIPDLLHAMDVMVFPSLFEGLSVTLVEAQASGLRCVVSDSINPANYLSENTIPLSLNAGAEVWADVVMDDTIKNLEYGNIEDYDMNREIRRLERLYRGQMDV